MLGYSDPMAMPGTAWNAGLPGSGMLFELVQQLGGLPQGVLRGCQLLPFRVRVLLPACRTGGTDDRRKRRKESPIEYSIQMTP